MPLTSAAFRGLARGMALAAALTVAAPAVAAPHAPDQFPLGQSRQSGAVCQAVRNNDSPAVQTRGARAWDVRCRGWDTPLGSLYDYSYRGSKDVGASGIWSHALAQHAQCGQPSPIKAAGLDQAQRSDCTAFAAKVSYLAYTGEAHGRFVAAEGYAQLGDVLETGLRVVAGVARPPKATQAGGAPTASAATGQSLAAAASAASSTPEALRESGYNENISWQFDQAETKFRSLALNPNIGDQVRAEAYLNWALNSSNTGHYDEASALFKRADRFIGRDAELRGLSLSYRALDQRNQRRFKEAVVLAEQARKSLAGLQPVTTTATGAGVTSDQATGDLTITPDAASALVGRPMVATAGSVDVATRIRVQIAQVDLTEATAVAALGDMAASHHLLQEAREILTQPELAGIAGWLRAQVEAELARQDEAAGHSADARAQLVIALSQLRLRLSGSAAEAFLEMEIARLDALAGRREQAISEYREALALFRDTRGSLGASADSAAIYLDLLSQAIAADPAHSQDDAEHYLSALQSLGGGSTAQVVAQLSARLNQGDSAVAGLIRALEDTRRQLRVKQSEIAQLQSQNAYGPAIRAVSEAEVKSLNDQAVELEQRVAAADPRYGQLVASDVTLKDLMAALKPGEAYLKVVLLSDRGYGMLISDGSYIPFKIKIGLEQAEAEIQALRRPFETHGYLPSYDVARSYRLFESLFQPVQDQLLAAHHIIYEPDPSILNMPIAALAVDQASVDLIASRRAAIKASGGGVLSYDRVRWLGRGADVSLVVSAASFVQARNFAPSHAAHAFLGMGDALAPQPGDARAFASVVNFSSTGRADEDVCSATRQALFDLKPLKEARDELNAVGASIDATDDQIISGADFNDGAILARHDMDQYRVVYFATHGLLPAPGGCLPEPALLTSVGPVDSDGLLSSSKILNLRLDADLVVLSACDTGGGAASADSTGLAGGGEALSGLARAFIYAGARSLIVSQWSIDSGATVRLMSKLFAAHARSQAGALHEAMLSLMDSQGQFSHPYYWAPFALVGDGARPMPER